MQCRDWRRRRTATDIPNAVLPARRPAPKLPRGKAACNTTAMISSSLPTVGKLWAICATGTMTLTGPDTLANYQAALQSVTYENTSGTPSTLTRTVSFTVNDGDTDSNTVVRNIDVVLDASAPVVVANTGSTVAEGGMDPITAAELSYADAIQPATSVTYTVTAAPSSGRVELTTAPGVAIGNFTQAQLDANQVVYIHGGSEGAADSFNFMVDDGQGNVLGGQTFSLTVTPVNDAPVTAVPVAQSILQDTALVFSGAGGNTIVIGDVDAGGAVVSVTLTASNGTVSLNGTAGLVFGTGDGAADATMMFTGTLADVNAALDGLSFSPTTGYAGTASLQIAVDDLGNTGAGSAQITIDTVGITVNAVVLPPPLPPVVEEPVPEPEAEPAPELEAESEPAPEDADEVDGDVELSSEGSDGAARTVPVQAPAAEPKPKAQAAEPRPEATVKASDPEPVPVAGASVLGDLGDAPATAALIGPAPSVAREVLSFLSKIEELSFATQNKEFLEDLDRIREDVAAPAHIEAAVVGSTVAVTTGLSVGYVIWLLRGGLLLASVLTSMPAWRAFDPLPVLAHLRNRSEEEGEDQDSLDDLIRKRAEMPASSPEPMPGNEFRPGADLDPSPAQEPASRDGRSIHAEEPERWDR